MHWSQNHGQLANLITWNTALSNSVQLSHAMWGHPGSVIMMEAMWSTEKGMAKHFSILALRSPWTVWEGRMMGVFKGELPMFIGSQYATGDQWRNNSRKNEEMEPKQNQQPVMDGTGDGRKAQCYKEQYCIGTRNVRSMNQGKLEGVKQEMARVNVDMLGISKLKWTGMGDQI